MLLLQRRWIRLHLFSRLYFSSMTSSDESYTKAVFELNKLQTNASVLSKLRQDKTMCSSNVPESLKFLRYLDISLDKIDDLNCIHVTGTKGKGSTCAFVESILQSLGFKTGFYSSPHLIHVNERIRIDGRPISKNKFAKNFFDVYDAIQEKKTDDEAMPGYFKFLTLMAFKVFCDEAVDVAIIEVGIGGENDCTNIIRRPTVCGISTLDFDHTSLLGLTLSEIAWQKAGIMKSNSVLVTVQQSSDPMKVIYERSKEKNCPVYEAPDLSTYTWPNSRLPNFGIDGDFQHTNVSLALQLARFWLLRSGKASGVFCSKFLFHISRYYLDFTALNLPSTDQYNMGFNVPPLFVTGLEKCFWPGRAQTLKRGNLVFFLDSAHTPQSIMHCAKWFQTSTDLHGNNLRVLLFHYTADRDPNVLLSALKECNFNIAVFCPTQLKDSTASNDANDITNVIHTDSTDSEEMKKCIANERLWRSLAGESKTCVLSCVEKAVGFIDSLAENNIFAEVHVLVTGSLHLVGGVLSFKNPNIF